MNVKKFSAAVTAVIMSAGTFGFFPETSLSQVSADAVYVANDFDVTYEGWCNMGEQVKLEPDWEDTHGGTRSMAVTDRLSPEDGVSSAKGFYLWGGRKYDYKVFVKHNSGADENFKLTLSYLLSDETTWETATIAESSVSSGEWTEVGGSFTAPEGATEEERKALEEYVALQNLSENVIFHGAIYDEKVLADQFSHALLCISPTQGGLSVPKSMGYGVPFVTRKDAITGGEIYHITPGVNGIMYDKDDDLLNILSDACQNSQKYIEMGVKAQEYYNNNATVLHMAQGAMDAIEYVLNT